MKPLLLMLFFVLPIYVNAQSTKENTSNPSKPGRFVIVQSPIAVKATFKLDTYTGDVYQLVVDTAGKNSWQLMLRETSAIPDTRYPDSNNYSLFVSTLSVKYTYLFNVNTGATWVFVEDIETKQNFFKPMVDR